MSVSVSCSGPKFSVFTYQSIMIIWGCISLKRGPVSWLSLLMGKGLYEQINQDSHRAEQSTKNK